MSYWQRLQARLHPPSLVLCYHRVTELPSDPFNCCVSPTHFAEHLEVLRNRYTVPVFKRLIDVYEPQRRPGRRTVIITFDDGYADNLHTAAPLLQEFGFHAVFYVFTGWIERIQEAWWDRLERAVAAANLLPPVLRLRGIEGEFRTADHASFFMALYDSLRDTSACNREVALEDFGVVSNGPEVRPDYRPLTGEELRDLASRTGVHIGAHTVTHAFLPRLSPREQQIEIAQSREWLERELGLPVTDLSYPHGGENADTRAAAAAAGMRTAVTSEARTTCRGGDPLAIPRVTVQNWDGDEFARRLEWWFTH